MVWGAIRTQLRSVPMDDPEGLFSRFLVRLGGVVIHLQKMSPADVEQVEVPLLSEVAIRELQRYCNGTTPLGKDGCGQ